ncbi:MAG: 16S rRNA (guanine(527)-N(7))-methyltransferase RsmG [Spongiibacteraceae bacterium]
MDNNVSDPQVLRAQLQRGLATLALTLPGSVVEQLLQYLALLAKWNRAYNLTAVRDIEQMVSRHLLDSLAVLPFIQGKKLQAEGLRDKGIGSEKFADVGTGAGLPGLVLAIAAPHQQFDLFDSNGKKIRFVKQAIGELKLANVTAFQSRIEQWQPDSGYDAVLSRAFASLSEMAALCEHLLAPGGRLLAMKGNYPDDEIAALPPHWQLQAAHALQVPDEPGQRHLIILSRRQ